jgi:hypothetical protein
MFGGYGFGGYRAGGYGFGGYVFGSYRFGCCGYECGRGGQMRRRGLGLAGAPRRRVRPGAHRRSECSTHKGGRM